MPDIAGKLFPNLTTLIVQLLSTGVLLLIFKKFLWKNVMEYFAKRADYIESTINEAKEMNEKASTNLETAEKEAREAASKYREILDQAKKDNYGVTSIMVDRSSLSYEDNIAQTKETVKMCRPLNISVEAELGHVGQSEDYSSDGSDHFTKPEEVKKFVEETGIDCLAVAIGTAHGRYHGTPHIDFNLLKQITDVVDIPLVLHGGSGTGDENLRKAVKNGIQKVNLATELVVAGKEELETFIQDKNFDKWQLIPSFIKGYSDRLEHYVKLFDQENRAW